ncbi:lipase secretion chaperone [Roseateles amylovorans]|uniref:Lipase helper protein n=1 Tax=Roseateles amylovorans TaxID=2978473 RepID=A0ABY6B753_9BURK|nr:lipase secretion chaperone [Roseateles amylovorans]UXH80764.1 lipase secretion chaperone [Roseateles amylovorans]
MSHKPVRKSGRRFGAVIAVGLGAAILLAGVILALRPPAADKDPQPGAAFPWTQAAVAKDPSTVSSPDTSSGTTGLNPMPDPAALAQLAPTGAGRGKGVFRIDESGRLVVDQATRVRAEALLALNEGQALTARIESELAELPAPAAAGARELLAQFDAYQNAQRAAFPPGNAPLVPEEGLAQLDALQALRAAHFGADAAKRMFAEDDAVSRRLLELMRDDTSTALSMQEKAMRAQAKFDLERGAVRP